MIGGQVLESHVALDAYTEAACAAFDVPFDGKSSFTVPSFEPPADFSIGLIVGPSGSGKSSLLKDFGGTWSPVWEKERAVISHFASPADGIDCLTGVGLNSIPAWLRPAHVLSTGERYRADLARILCNDAVVDEFTSTVDRNVARSTARAVSRFVRSRGWRRVVFSSCHYDIVDWLEPDWVFDTATKALSLEYLQRPSIGVTIHAGGKTMWPIFAPHHYLTSKLAAGARCFLAFWNDTLVGFASSISMPNGYLKNAWREHRTVVLPDFQGLGIGVRLSDAVGQIHLDEGKRYYSRTAHIRMGEYRNASPLWRATSKNRKLRTDAIGHEGFHNYVMDSTRIAYSHEYIGASA